MREPPAPGGGAGTPTPAAGRGARRPGRTGPARLRPGWLALGVLAVLVAAVAGLAVGPVRLNPLGVLLAVVDQLPGVHLNSGLSAREAAIVTELRLPRVCLGLLVGATLALSGGCYQGVFRNPLADPYLLGAAAGAGLGATIAIVSGTHSDSGAHVLFPAAAFAGALVAVTLTYLVGTAGGGTHRGPAALILAGVAVTSFFTAAQTYLQQRHADTLREVYSWILGRLSTSGWGDVLLLLPYALLTVVVVIALRRRLDVLTLGDDEAATLGVNPRRLRYTLVVAASLGTAAAVAVSGLIGFVGLIVPHTVRLLFGSSYRIVLPLSVLFGAAFLALADLAARTVASPAEIPIGVVTAFFGAPFFIVVLRTSKRM